MKLVVKGLVVSGFVVGVMLWLGHTAYADSIVVGCKCCSFAKSWCGVICC